MALFLITALTAVGADAMSWAISSSSGVTLRHVRALNDTSRLTAALLGGPSATDTSSCGTNSGTFPSLPVAMGSQVGCKGAFKSQQVSFKFTQGDTPSYNAYCILEMQGSQCTSSTKSNFVSGTCFALSKGGYFYSTQPYTCNDATCCLAIFCDNSVFSCSNLSYETTFAGTLSDGVVAGIVIGSIAIFLLIIVAICRLCCRTKNAAADSSTYAQITVNPQAAYAYQQPPNYQQHQQQSYQAPPQGYQQPAYQQPPNYQQHQQQSYQAPPQGYQQPYQAAPGAPSPQFMTTAAPLPGALAPQWR